MALYPEVVVAVAATAAVLPPRVRKALRRGAVYGLAGVLMASDAVSSVASATARRRRARPTPLRPP